MRNNYVYKNPLENGYKKSKISKKDYNKIFTNNPMKFGVKYCIYYNENQFLIERYDAFYIKLLILLSLPISILRLGIIEVIKELPRAMFQKKYGSFVADVVWRKEDESSCFQMLKKVDKNRAH